MTPLITALINHFGGMRKGGGGGGGSSKTSELESSNKWARKAMLSGDTGMGQVPKMMQHLSSRKRTSVSVPSAGR